MLDSELLGRGKSIGAIFDWVNGSNSHHLTANTMIFDDIPEHSRHAYNTATTPPNRESNVDVVVEIAMTFASGITRGGDFHADGFKVFPYGSTLFFNEAFTSFVNRWLPTVSIKSVRTEFMRYLRTEIGLANVLNRPFHELDYVDEPESNSQDLGGGNTILPYAVKESLDVRLIQEVTPEGIHSFNHTRVYEGGFMLRVGSAGLRLADGLYLPLGAEIRFGFYVVRYNSNLVLILRFQDQFPRIPDSIVHAPFLQRVTRPDRSDEGRCVGTMIAEPLKTDLRFTCIWGNFE